MRTLKNTVQIQGRKWTLSRPIRCVFHKHNKDKYDLSNITLSITKRRGNITTRAQNKKKESGKKTSAIRTYCGLSLLCLCISLNACCAMYSITDRQSSSSNFDSISKMSCEVLPNRSKSQHRLLSFWMHLLQSSPLFSTSHKNRSSRRQNSTSFDFPQKWRFSSKLRFSKCRWNRRAFCVEVFFSFHSGKTAYTADYR